MQGKILNKENISRDSLIIFIFAIFFVLPHALAEILFGGETPKTIWYIRIIDLVDITVMTIVYISFFMYLQIIVVEKTNQYLLKLYQVFFLLFIGAHFMHFATNAVNTYAYEVMNYTAGKEIPQDVASLLYFLDEELSHYIMFSSLFAMWLIVIIARFITKAPSFPEKRPLAERIVIFLSVIIFGAVFTISAIEARKAYFVIGLEVIVIILMLFISYIVTTEKIFIKIRKDPIIQVMLFSIIFSLLFFLAYYLYFGGFIEPSEILRGHTY